MAAELFKQTLADGAVGAPHGQGAPVPGRHLRRRGRRATGPEIVTCDGEPPEDVGPARWPRLRLGRRAGPRESAIGSTWRWPPMARAGKILMVGRLDPVLRNRERQWISTMAGLADYGCRDASWPGRSRGPSRRRPSAGTGRRPGARPGGPVRSRTPGPGGRTPRPRSTGRPGRRASPRHLRPVRPGWPLRWPSSPPRRV